MTEQYKAGYPLAPANGYSRSDQEAVRANSNQHRQKQKKWTLYIIGFVTFQTGIIVLFTFAVMKFRTPKFCVRFASSFDTFDVQPVTPSFNLRMNAQLGGQKHQFWAPSSMPTPPSISTTRVQKLGVRLSESLKQISDLLRR